MRKPISPGQYFYETYIEEHGLLKPDIARHIGITEKALANFIGGTVPLNAELAYRLAKATGKPARDWLNMQTNYELWKNRHLENLKIDSIV
ncbi:HigA family addiction module antitoxin [Endozoicomonas sp. Mp262]|uniref:HigA family addiction module antitoxin n=1 Tax=Endozoicomonas sp. Mp262 TaxID=2919499 RepID=UPI0021DFE5F7